MKRISLWIIALALAHSFAYAEQGLGNCIDQFIDGNIQNASNLNNSPTLPPYDNNVHLCYRDDNVSFFIIELWPNEFSSRWAAYKLSPENYGENGCLTFTRDIANCYIRKNTWAQSLSCIEEEDPSHQDYIVKATS